MALKLRRSIFSKTADFESACPRHAIVCTTYFLPTLTCGVIENGSLWEHLGIIPFNLIGFIITGSFFLQDVKE